MHWGLHPTIFTKLCLRFVRLFVFRSEVPAVEVPQGPVCQSMPKSELFNFPPVCFFSLLVLIQAKKVKMKTKAGTEGILESSSML